ncbi:hypothetical protein GYH30_000253 [Glycine max]|nr:hypothetical protein GYH30_000253 [Glycine max]
MRSIATAHASSLLLNLTKEKSNRSTAKSTAVDSKSFTCTFAIPHRRSYFTIPH